MAQYFFRKVCIFAILSLLLLGLGACNGAKPAQPTLTPSESPAGSPTATQEQVAPTLPPPPTATPAPQPPALIESNPPLGAEIAINAPITLYFNQPMDRPSVESALSSQGGAMGSFSWADDSTITFKPAQPFIPETNINLSLAQSARAANGLALQAPLELGYHAAGYLKLSQRVPEPESADVNPTGAVVAAFNRPVAPLGADPATLPAAFTLAPPVNGRGEWVNTSTYIFYPDPALAGGVNYTVTLNPALQAVDGAPLSESQPWGFSTALPTVLTTMPTNGMNGFLLNAPVQITFNQPVDVGSVQAAFSLADSNGQAVAGAFGWNADFTTLTYTPTQRLAYNFNYTLTLNPGARGLGGAEISGLPHSLTFITAFGLSVWNTQVSESSVALSLLAPPGDVDPLKYIQLDPPVADLSAYVSPDYQYTDFPAAYVLRLNGTFVPETNYSLTLSPDFPDMWGGTLGQVNSGQAYVLPFRSPRLAPNLIIPLATETLFTTPRDGGLPAQVVNLPVIALTSGSVPVNDFITMLGPNGYDFKNNYTPANAVSWAQSFGAQARNVANAVEIPLVQNGALAPGLYHLRINFDEANLTPQMYLVAVSNIHLTFKLSNTDVLVWAVDTRTSQPVANAPLAVYAEDGAPLAAGTTDGDGIFRSSIPGLADPYATRYAVLGQPGDDIFGIALSTWSAGVEASNFGIASDYTLPRQSTYLYTDRPIYRPGQTVYFRGIVRQANNGRYALPAENSIAIKLFDDLGGQISTYNLSLSALGTAHGSFDLPFEARPGFYRFEAGADSLYFQVADYRKPEINLQVAFSASDALSTTPLQATVNARYFFDAPASNVKVHWTLYSQPDRFDLPGYQVGDENDAWLMAFYNPQYDLIYGSLLKEGDGQTGPEGTLTIEIPARPDSGIPEQLPPLPTRQRYLLEVTATDETGVAVSARSYAIIHPTDFYIGLRPDSWNGQAGADLGFTVQTVDWAQAPYGNRPLHAEFRKVTWKRVEAAHSFAGPTFEPQYTSIAQGDFTTGADGVARLSFKPADPGAYQLVVSGGNALSQLTVWVGGAGQAVWPNIPNNRLRLTADRAGGASYKPGDTAQVFVPNPFGVDCLALVTVERGVVIRHQVLSLAAAGSTLPFPLTGEDAPNVYVSVIALGQDAAGFPDFRQGYLNLLVEPVEQVLKVTVTTDPPRAGPGETVTIKVHVSDAAGAPVQGEFSLSVVDLAVLSLADPNALDIVPAYYGIQPLGVRTGHSLAAYSRRMVYMPGGLGGGGGADSTVARENFPDTALWRPDLTTDANGDAQVTLTLPDSLTTWQIDVRGITSDGRVGQAQAQLVATQDFLVRPAAPRFLVAGDHLQLAAIVQNNTTADVQANVTLQAVGVTLDDPTVATQIALIPPQGRTRVVWWVSVQEDAPSADITITAKSENYSDAVRLAGGALPVLRYTAPQTFATSGILTEGGERLELVSLPATFIPQGGSLNVTLSSSLASAALQALDVLEHYPYGCTEQTLSRFWPNLETLRTMQAFGVTDADLQARLDRTLNDGLARLLARQNTDGGWSWWASPPALTPAYGGTPPSDPFITAYVLFGLGRAQNMGIAAVGPDMIQRAADFLIAGLTTPEMSTAPGDLDRLAFIHFALTEAGKGDAGGAAALYESRAALSPWAQALLALTLEKLSPGSSQAATLITDLEASAVRSATGVSWQPSADARNLGTPLTNSAIVLYAIAQRNPASSLLPDAMRSLMAHRGADGAWGSTYETAWSLIAINEYMKATQELAGAFTFDATLNGQTIASGQAGAAPVSASIPLANLYPADPNALLLTRQPGNGVLYYTAALFASRPVETAPALNQGLSIARQYRVGSQPLAGPAAVGQKVTVHLTIALPNDAYYLIVEDYIPAGSEIMDVNLKTTQQQPTEAEALPPYDPGNPAADGWGWWYFSQPRIYDDHIAWAADTLPAGTYELTYTLIPLQAGQYRVLPARAWQFYFPEVQGTSAGMIFEIK